MAARIYLGEFELMVMLVLIRLGEGAYGVPICDELRHATGREAAIGSVYAALDRLQEKGYATSALSDPTPARGGRAKRYFHVTKEGVAAVNTTRTALTRLWRGIPTWEAEPT